jgi:hypothetical protein
MKIVEFIADDLGLDDATNLAIEHCYREGVLRGASLMLGQKSTKHGVEVARRNPRLRIGWHFHACDSQPLTRKCWPWGRSTVFAGLAFALLPAARELIRREINAQWKQFEATDLTCEFINGHHHLHIHPFLAREMRAVVPQLFNGWIRGFNVKSFDSGGLGVIRCLRRPSQRWLRDWRQVRCSDTLWGVDRLFSMDSSEVTRAIGQLPDGLHEFMFHPRGGPNDADMRTLLALRNHPGLVEMPQSCTNSQS